jgi:NAD(P)-dependent dehydrogenase (short-subunit alcohol dehydrogenase family)
MNRLQNKVCLVTGAGGAIGQATAKAFKDEGAIVVGTIQCAEAARVYRGVGR